MRDIKGTWLITHSKGQIVEGGKITSTRNRDVTSKQNHFVFYNDGRAVFMDSADCSFPAPLQSQAALLPLPLYISSCCDPA